MNSKPKQLMLLTESSMGYRKEKQRLRPQEEQPRQAVKKQYQKESSQTGLLSFQFDSSDFIFFLHTTQKGFNKSKKKHLYFFPSIAF